MDIGFTLQKALKDLKTQRWSKLDFSGAKMAKITLKMHDTEFFHLISYGYTSPHRMRMERYRDSLL